MKLPTTLTDDTQALGHSIEIRYKPIHNLKTEKTANQIVLSSNYGTTNSQMESKLDSTKDPRVLGSLMIKPDIFDSKPTVKVTVNDHKWGEINKDSVYLPNWVSGKKVMVQQSAKRVKLVQTNKKLIEKEKSYSIIFLSGALLTMFIFIMITKYKQGASL